MSVREMPGPIMFEVITHTEGGKFRERSVFTLDEVTGLFMAESPYGTFSYYWPPAYRCSNLYTFIAGLDFDYFMNKAAKQPYREMDLERTLKGCRRDLIEERRKWGDPTKDRAREIWDALKSIEHNGPFSSEESFLHHWYYDSTLGDWRQPYDISVTRRDRYCARFFFDTILDTLIKSDAYRARIDTTPHERKSAA